MSFTFLATPFSVVASMVLVGLTAGLSWAAWRRSGYLSRVGWLEFLRTLIVGLVAITLNQPELMESYRPDERPTLLVLSDTSGSMLTRDVPNFNSLPATTSASPDDSALPRPREEGLQTRQTVVETLQKQSFWEETRTQLDVQFVPFNSFLDDPNAGTDIGKGLHDGLQKFERLQAVILLSDGDWNLGDPPSQQAGRYRVKNVPIHVVPIGSEQKLPDVELERFDLPTFGVVDKSMRIPFSLRSSLPRDVDMEVRLIISAAGVVNEDRVIPHKVTLPAMGSVDDTILWKPEQIGDYRIHLEVPAQSEEVVTTNNDRTEPISIRKEAIRVLLVESYPRWEYRYLRNALERDPGVDVECLLFHPTLSKFGGGRGYLQAFPNDMESLAKYDVVFLGDVGIGDQQLTLEQCRLLKGLVQSQASGLILMPGMRGHQLSLLHSELQELYPVVLDPAQPRGWGSRVPSQMELTEMGRSSLLTKLEDQEDENARVWESLPGFHWYAASLRAKAGSEVLATHQSEISRQGRVPLLVTKSFGTGKVLFMGTDNAWRWRKGVEDKYHYRFWGQVARWMAYQRSIAQGERMRLFYTPDRPKAETQVTLNANVMSADGEPLQHGQVSVQAIAPSGMSETIRLREVGDEWGLYSGTFRPKEHGDYRMILSSQGNDDSLETRLAVHGVDRERVGEPVRTEVLAELAKMSRGTVVAWQDVETLVTQLRELPEPEPIVRRFRLWCHPAWGTLIVLLLGLFWSGRKLAGQV